MKANRTIFVYCFCLSLFIITQDIIPHTCTDMARPPRSLMFLISLLFGADANPVNRKRFSDDMVNYHRMNKNTYIENFDVVV